MKKPCDKKRTITWIKGVLTSLCLTLLLHPARAQETPDANYFKHYGGIQIKLLDKSQLSNILNWPGVTPDHGHTRAEPLLYVSESAYNTLLEHHISFDIVAPEKANIRMVNEYEWQHLKHNKSCLDPIDYYPTYEAYEAMMQDFADNHPELCRLTNIGTLNSGRKILAARITSASASLMDKPRILLTATMHGDETAGYPLMLQLIDHLLCQYSDSEIIKNILDHAVVYINPLANPDGTFRSGNHTVEGAIRYNATFTDLNRNYPDPEDGLHPDGRPYQQETSYFMSFADSAGIDLACNLHGGAELANYPWDTYDHAHADNLWWQDLCRNYADTVQHYGPEGYFTDRDNGITNGYDWYEVRGGRQDYMTYYKRAREFTLELSQRKLLDSDDLPTIWAAHKNAMIHFLEEALYGVNGLIVDCLSGQPVNAEIYIPDHDMDNSSVFTDSVSGYFYRYLSPGDYTLMITAPGYDSLYVAASVSTKEAFILNTELCPLGTSSVKENPLADAVVRIIEKRLYIESLPVPVNVQVYDLLGRQVLSAKDVRDHVSLAHLTSGAAYIVSLDNGPHRYSVAVYLK